MSEMNGPALAGQPGELRMTIEVKRAATGKTDVFELIGTPIPEPKGEQDGGNALNIGA